MNLDASLVIPAFNADRSIADAIRSAAAQRPRFREIIVVDDGSSDATETVVRSLAIPEVIYHYQPNSGPGRARNAGIEIATSTYLCFLDADDLLASDATQVMATALMTHGKMADAFLFSAEVVYRSGNRRVNDDYYRRRNQGHHASGGVALTTSLSKRNFLASPCLYVFRRALLQRIPKLRFNDELHEDESFTPALLLRCGTTIVWDVVLYKRVLKAGSIMSQCPGVSNVRGMLRAAQAWLEYSSKAKGKERRLHFLQAHRCYCTALRYAARAQIGQSETSKLVCRYAPQFRTYVSFDYSLALLSKRVAFEVAHLRAKLLTCCL